MQSVLAWLCVLLLSPLIQQLAARHAPSTELAVLLCCCVICRRAVAAQRQQLALQHTDGAAADDGEVHVLDIGAGTGLLSMMAVRWVHTAGR